MQRRRIRHHDGLRVLRERSAEVVDRRNVLVEVARLSLASAVEERRGAAEGNQVA